jgi:hypothetical protein
MQNLGLEAVGVEMDKNGAIVVGYYNNWCQVSHFVCRSNLWCFCNNFVLG